MKFDPEEAEDEVGAAVFGLRTVYQLRNDIPSDVPRACAMMYAFVICTRELARETPVHKLVAFVSEQGVQASQRVQRPQAWALPGLRTDGGQLYLDDWRAVADSVERIVSMRQLTHIQLSALFGSLIAELVLLGCPVDALVNVCVGAAPEA